jgi:hypothetical protein
LSNQKIDFLELSKRDIHGVFLEKGFGVALSQFGIVKIVVRKIGSLLEKTL